MNPKSTIFRLTLIILSLLIVSSCDVLKPDPDDPPDDPPVENVGKLKWSSYIGDNLYAFGSPAIGADGTIYIAGSGGQVYWTPTKIYAINPDSTLKWQSGELDHIGISSEICIGSDGTIYVIGYFTLYAINPSNGTFRWTWDVVPGDYNQIRGLTIGNDGTLFFTNDEVYAVTSIGQTKWISNPDDRRYASNVTIGKDGTLYVYRKKWNDAAGAMFYYIVAMNPDNGNRIWQTPLPDDSEVWGEYSIAITEGGDLIVATRSPDQLVKIEASSGNVLWNKTAVPGYPSIAPNGDIIIFSANVGLHCYNSSGNLKWNIGNGLSGFHKVAIDSDGKIYVNGGDFASEGNFQCFDSNGNLVWATYLDLGDNYCPAISNNGTIYIRGANGLLLAVQGDKPLATNGWPRSCQGNRNSRNASW